MSYMYLEKPCRNYCFRASMLFIDPKDGCEKVILSSYVAGGTGELIIIDPETGEGETLVIPGDSGAYALLVLDNKLLVGTCGRFGYLHRLDLCNRQWDSSLKCDGITYIWDIALASDGYVYGGTYPGCALLRYDPVHHTLTNLGPMTKYEENLYSRNIFTPVKGKVYMNCGMAKTCIGVYDIDKDTMSQVLPGCRIIRATEQVIILDTPAGEKTVDAKTFEEVSDIYTAPEILENDYRLPVPSGFLLKTSKGKLFGLCGQRYFIIDKNDIKPTFYNIPGSPPATEIFAMTVDDEGMIYGATGLGGTMFTYDPKTNQYYNSDILTARAGGEAYGVVAHEDKVYFTLYSGGEHVVYDPKKEWNRNDNINPKTIKKIGPEYIRPQARSFLGPDNNIWTGWIAKYGSYGSAISEINTKTFEVRLFSELIKDQGIGSITGDDEHIYFTTNGSGNGLKAKTEGFYLVKMDKNGLIKDKISFEKGVQLAYVYYSQGKLYLFILHNKESNLFIYNANNMELISCQTIDYLPSRIVQGKQDDLLVVARKMKNSEPVSILAIANSADFSIKREAVIPGVTAAICYNKVDGYIYFAHHTELYRMDYE